MATYKRILNDREIDNIKNNIDKCKTIIADLKNQVDALDSLNKALDCQKEINLRQQSKLAIQIENYEEAIIHDKERLRDNENLKRGNYYDT